MTDANLAIWAGACFLIGCIVTGGIWALCAHLRLTSEWAEELAYLEKVDQLDLDTSPPPELARHNEAPNLADQAVRDFWRAVLPVEIPDGRVAALHHEMERVRDPEDTQSWRIDPATNALIAPRHTRYFDWPEMSELFRPIPPPAPNP